MPTITAITRDVSASIGDCELSFIDRTPIDVARATEQLRSYRECLVDLGAHVVALAAEDALPDAVFVEDTAVVLDEVAVVAIPGAESRRPEVVSMADALARYRPVEFMREGTLDGGDVMHVGRTIFVGRTARTSDAGIDELRRIVSPHGYEVRAVAVDGCLHMKSACSYLGDGRVIVTPTWIDVGAFREFEAVDVAESEPWAANTIYVGDTVVVSSAFPKTRALIEERGIRVVTLDISEFQKAEGGLSCLSILLGHEA